MLKEIIHAHQQALQELGYSQAAAALQAESGISVNHPSVQYLRNAVGYFSSCETILGSQRLCLFEDISPM
jgi:hypothetical protein